ncbi:MAG: hypothetical protein IPM29_00880 [Planctomycetes bacterium]|nr:hypothetical protein [Planctomycetota bacterium]
MIGAHAVPALVAAALAALASSGPPAQVTPQFVAAEPIWPVGRATERNLEIGFRAVLAGDVDRPLLRIAAASIYRVTCNGAFVGHGPARAAHGTSRVDEWDLTPWLRPGADVVAVEVAGYAVNSYYLLDEPSFLCAEVVDGGRVLAATGAGGPPDSRFDARALTERVQRVQRYSFQRPFVEAYRLTPGHDSWRLDPTTPAGDLELERRPLPRLLPRRVPYPSFERRQPTAHVAAGTLELGVTVERPWQDRALTAIGPTLGGYPERDLETVASLELQTIRNATVSPLAASYDPQVPVALAPATFHTLDLGTDLTGFIGAHFECTERARLHLTFDEILRDGDVDWKRLGCVNAITVDLEPGSYDFESIEPYTLRYLKVLAVAGRVSLTGIGLRELANPHADRARFAASDPRLLRVFEAARETFRQNAVDVFMDCPSRERAGWLCDSFFTARTAFDLCGEVVVERAFLENFAMPERFEHLPAGMLPMCYPADHDDGVFIPNWAMWFVVELREYLARSGDRALVEALRPRVLALLELLATYRNDDGLLERLPSWVFVEWSRANDFVQDVNYPSNMLYAGALDAAAALYDLPDLAADATRVRDAVRSWSFDGEFFVDNAVRRDGVLQVTRNRTEVCQYFAFFFDVASPRSHPELWRRLVDEFGPHRAATGAWPEVHPANAFVGNVLRLELLSRQGLGQQLLDESIDYQLYMAERTGTLWENTTAHASCNHGFASHAAHVLLRDVLGVYRVDPVARRVTIRFTDVGLEWCEGVVPTPAGRVELAWRRADGALRYRLAIPAGYTVAIENRSGLAVEPQR